MIGINRGRLDFSDYLCRVDLGSQKNGFFNGLLGGCSGAGGYNHVGVIHDSIDGISVGERTDTAGNEPHSHANQEAFGQ